jgi:FkbM family methyltransferase
MKTTNSSSRKENTKLEKYKDVWIRPDTYDKFIVDEMRTYSLLPIPHGAIVLDVGGNIGAFARYALLERLAGEVISIEPEPENFRLMVKNTHNLKVTNIQAAATYNQSSSIYLYVNGKTNKALHSTVPTRGRDKIEVPTRPLINMLQEFKPSVMKIDVEGAEYDLLQTKIPKYIKHVAVEWHLTKASHREEAIQYHAALMSEFDSPKEPDFTTGAWTQMGIYTR